MVRRRDDRVFLHLLDQLRRLVIPDPQLPLDLGGRAFAVFLHDGDGRGLEDVGVAVGPPDPNRGGGQ